MIEVVGIRVRKYIARYMQSVSLFRSKKHLARYMQSLSSQCDRLSLFGFNGTQHAICRACPRIVTGVILVSGTNAFNHVFTWTALFVWSPSLSFTALFPPGDVPDRQIGGQLNGSLLMFVRHVVCQTCSMVCTCT